MITTHPYSLDVIPCKYGVSSQIPTFFCDISICLLLGVGVNIFDRVTTVAYQVTQKLYFFYEIFSNDTSFNRKGRLDDAIAAFRNGDISQYNYGTYLRDFKQLKLILLFNVEPNLMIICFLKLSKIVFAFSSFYKNFYLLIKS